MAQKKVYRVVYYNQDDVYEIYASYVYSSELYGFIEVEQLLFGERSQLLVDPGEEKLKNEFAGVKRTYIPINAIIRVDEVESEGVPKVKSGGNSVTSFPKPPGRPGGSN